MSFQRSQPGRHIGHEALDSGILNLEQHEDMNLCKDVRVKSSVYSSVWGGENESDQSKGKPQRVVRRDGDDAVGETSRYSCADMDRG